MKLTPIVNVCDSLVLIRLMVSIPLQLFFTDHISEPLSGCRKQNY